MHAISEEARAFYEKIGFEPSPSDAMLLMATLSDARAMKTMGLSSLYLVQPKLFPNAEATAMAAGADDLLFRAVVADVISA